MFEPATSPQLHGPNSLSQADKTIINATVRHPPQAFSSAAPRIATHGAHAMSVELSASATAALSDLAAGGERESSSRPFQELASASGVSTALAHQEAPLVIDLDGTLIRTNMLLECALAYLKQTPLALFQMMLWLLRGRVYLKAELARRVALDPALLPLNSSVQAYGMAEKARGRQVYLATAADVGIAQSIANHCGFFDGVFASHDGVNLKGQQKADALCRLFPAGFSYAGDCRADYPVWARTSEVILIGGARWAQRTATRLGKPARIFSTPSPVPALIESGRPHQWAKNVLVFVPAILSGVVADYPTMIAVAASFLALCIAASSTYLLNDLWDLQDDRKHWTKKNRPLASGRLTVGLAAAAVPLGLTISLALAMCVSQRVGIFVGIYIALTLAYSFGLKRIPILDVTILAGLFTLRLALGIVSAGVFASPWLLVFSMLLFSSLCFAKRYVEVEKSAIRQIKLVASRGYESCDALLLMALGISTGIASLVLLVLYVMFDAFQQTFYGNSSWLWAFPLILFLWLARIWLMACRGKLDDDPVAFAVGDAASIALGSAMFAAFILAWSGVFA